MKISNLFNNRPLMVDISKNVNENKIVLKIAELYDVLSYSNFIWQICKKSTYDWVDIFHSDINEIIIDHTFGITEGDKIRCIFKLDNKVIGFSSTYKFIQEDITLINQEKSFCVDNGVSENNIGLMIDSLSGVEFENFCMMLLKSNGFRNVKGTKATGDYGVDITAEKDDITYAFQCKCYSSPIGNKAVQEVFSGKSYYNCMVAVVITNNYFTDAAIKTAEKNQVLLWDRERLINMVNNSHLGQNGKSYE